MSRKTIALVTGLVFLTVILVALALKTSLPTPVKPPSEEPKVTLAPVAKTTLSLDPSPASLKGNTATLTVNMDSQDNEVTAVQLEMSYDPKVLSLVSITPASIFANSVPLINTVDKKNGRISYALGLSPAQARTPLTGKTEVATMVFTKVGSSSASSQTEVTFLPKSLVSARGVNDSVLKESQGTTIRLNP